MLGAQAQRSLTARREIEGLAEDPRFWASGISLVAHMRSPKCPAVHMNTRMFWTPTAWWFGGGADLNPMREEPEDTEFFHGVLKAACDRHDPTYYPRYKAWADEYFWNRHRKEPRGVGGVFWKSGLTKVVTTESGSWPILPPTLGGSTVSLFQDVYAVPLLAPAFAAHMASYVELLMPVLLLFGLGSRFAAAVLLGMTLVIEIFVFPLDYLSHLLWAGPLIYILCYGPGAISIDYFIARKFFAPKD